MLLNHWLCLWLIFLTTPTILYGWNEWMYKTTWSHDPLDAISKELQWRTVWGSFKNYKGSYGPPRPRRGHSLHIIKTDDRSDYKGETYIVLFGGRDNDIKAEHIPRTYDVQSVNGTLEFKTYDEKPVNPCNDPNNTYYSDKEQENCNFTTSSIIDIGMLYNDVWAYKLCNSTANERGFDDACNSTGWVLWHPGALQGGCVIQLGIEVCTVPSERYNHGSVLFNDGCLYVYGGFSQRCEDFCDDIWFFDIYRKSWRQVYKAGDLTKFYRDYLFDEWVALDPAKVPIDNTKSKFAGPGRRWRHSMVSGKEFYDAEDGKYKQRMVIYGGHRLWHGYSPENSQDNNWNTYETRPIGGYLDDLWIYVKYLDYSFPGQAFKTNNGYWEKRNVKEQCYSDPGIDWSSRNKITCIKVKPSARAGHGSAIDDDRGIIWIFGGYATYYPYLSTDGAGSGPGVTSVGSGGFIPYPGYEYFKNDLWFYNMTSELWVEVEIPDDVPKPDPRVDMVFLLLGEIIFMHGGFSDNYIYDDLWYFNITSLRWLKKTTFVRPIYPQSCTDDFEFIQQNNCTKLLWPKHLERDSLYPFDVLPYSQQQYYWPDSTFGPYFGIFDRGFSTDVKERRNTNRSIVLDWNLNRTEDGTPMFPYAATGTMQYAKPFVYSFNHSHNATLFEYCTSVFAEPTRFHVTDGVYGRANGSIFIAQPRPRKPGWDGCRDRYDGRTDLPQGLQYVKPLPRFGHRAVFHESTTEILVYGGMAYTVDRVKTLKDSYPTRVLGDLWYYNLFHCANNCSSNGDCYYGFCKCYVGYYGVDCSNVSCPGTFCYYDEFSHEQICTHACQAGYKHTDLDIYQQDIAKIPCSRENLGESNGICDGFGSVMCAPPFIGDDCSIKDCKNNCSFNGWCSIEYPVSRCMCQPGYYGETCEYKVCLNNCSYPNGMCNTTSGMCQCNMMFSPFNNTRDFKPWGGEDCSYLFPYAGTVRNRSMVWIVTLVLVCFLLLGFVYSEEVGSWVGTVSGDGTGGGAAGLGIARDTGGVIADSSVQ